MRRWFPTDRDASGGACGCEPGFEGRRLVVESTACPGGGRLAAEPGCRATVVAALADREADVVATRSRGRERAYLDDATGLLVAAGRFVERAAFHDERLAEKARADPIAAAREATGRAGPVAEIAAETGLALGAERAAGYDDALRPHVGPTMSNARVRLDPPVDGRLADVRTLDTGATVRLYERPDGELDEYHLEPVESGFDDAAAETLVRAREFLTGGGTDGARAPGRAVRAVAGDDDPVETIGRVLAKHTRDLGVLVDLFADERVSDAFANAPAAETRLHVRVEGTLARTNVRLTDRGSEALTSQFRLRSGRAFSRADPTLDATVTVADRRVRVAGTTEPASDGLGFAFRAQGRDSWTLQRLVSNGTVPPDAAALLSVAVERAAATLLAGTRGAGKTTMLGALLWELPASVRTLVIEDTPELPVGDLRDAGRDVQSLRTESGDGPGLAAEEALRTALRLGEGALVVGEVRGTEAAVLYEAMRVGANGSAVLGTIHGDGGESVRERVVSDLDVPESSFATTDLVVTLEAMEREGERRRRVSAIEEVVADGDEVGFAPLFSLSEEGVTATGRVGRGNSRLIASLTEADESYAELRATLAARERRFREETAFDGEPTWTTKRDANPC